MSIFSFLRKHTVIAAAGGFLVIVVAVIGGRAATSTAPVVSDQAVKRVSLVNATSFRKNNIAVTANGIVESHSQVELKSQVSAPVSVINVSVGAHVNAGQVILELQNNDIRAQLSQAQASLLLAQGQSSTGSVSLDSAKQTAIDKVRNAYTQTYNAVMSQADPILYNNDGNGGRLSSYSSDNVINSEITSTALDLKASFLDWNTSSLALTNTMSVGDITAAIIYAKKQMAKADLLFSDISKILNGLSSYATPAFAANVNGWKATITAAQASVTAAEQALAGAEISLNTTSSSQGSTAPAQVSVAQAGVSNLEAQLAKTIIRSPLSGTVSALPLRAGELASTGGLLATVVGSKAGLEIKAYVSGDDLARIRVGTVIDIQQNNSNVGSTSTTTIKGIVSNVAPSVDVLTKQAEVGIDIVDSTNSNLVIGQTIAVSIPLAQAGPQGASIYNLPIQNVKIIPGAAYVLTVDANSKIVRHDVTLGAVQGDFIEVVGGLTDDMNIVTPVYELDEGQAVIAQ